MRILHKNSLTIQNLVEWPFFIFYLGLTKSAALCCGEKGYNIRVNSVHPGYIHTALTEEEARGYGLEPEEYFVKVGKQHPLGCIGEPNDIAYIDVYLASDESKWTTGAEFVVDGGWTAQ